MADLLKPILDSFFETDNPDPNEVVLGKIYSLREEIMSRLAQIENELENLNYDILDRIRGDNYIYGFGYYINSLKDQIENSVSILTNHNNTNRLSKYDKIVESAYYIGINKQWIKQEHIILNLKNVADTLSGQSFSMNEQRDLY